MNLDALEWEVTWQWPVFYFCDVMDYNQGIHLLNYKLYVLLEFVF